MLNAVPPGRAKHAQRNLRHCSSGSGSGSPRVECTPGGRQSQVEERQILGNLDGIQQPGGPGVVMLQGTVGGGVGRVSGTGVANGVGWGREGMSGWTCSRFVTQGLQVCCHHASFALLSQCWAQIGWGTVKGWHTLPLSLSPCHQHAPDRHSCREVQTPEAQGCTSTRPASPPWRSVWAVLRLCSSSAVPLPVPPPHWPPLCPICQLCQLS